MLLSVYGITWHGVYVGQYELKLLAGVHARIKTGVPTQRLTSFIVVFVFLDDEGREDEFITKTPL